MNYAHRYSTSSEFQVIHYFEGGSRIVSQTAPDYVEWLVTHEPTIEANGRFLSVVDNQLVVDPNKASILAAEEAARVVEAARIAAKNQAIVDNLPSWATVEAAIDAASTLAAMKVIFKKVCRVVYWDVKNQET